MFGYFEHLLNCSELAAQCDAFPSHYRLGGGHFQGEVLLWVKEHLWCGESTWACANKIADSGLHGPGPWGLSLGREVGFGSCSCPTTHPFPGTRLPYSLTPCHPTLTPLLTYLGWWANPKPLLNDQLLQHLCQRCFCKYNEAVSPGRVLIPPTDLVVN